MTGDGTRRVEVRHTHEFSFGLFTGLAVVFCALLLGAAVESGLKAIADAIASRGRVPSAERPPQSPKGV